MELIPSFNVVNLSNYRQLLINLRIIKYVLCSPRVLGQTIEYSIPYYIKKEEILM